MTCVCIVAGGDTGAVTAAGAAVLEGWGALLPECS
jgi:hypothetical protein